MIVRGSGNPSPGPSYNANSFFAVAGKTSNIVRLYKGENNEKEPDASHQEVR